MPKVVEIAPWSPALILLLAGCVHGGRDREVCCSPQAGDAPAPTILPIVARGTIAPDTSRLPSFAVLDASLKREREAVPSYRRLGHQECQCLAAQNSSLGNLLDQKAASLVNSTVDDARLATVQGEMAHDAALAARNRTVGSALELFYRLAESEGRHDLLKRSLAEIDDALSSGEEMKAKGMQLGDDFEILRRRRVTALQADIELELALGELNGGLKHLLSLGPDAEPWRIWPDADWKVGPEDLNAAAAVAVGLERRPELVLLRRLCASMSTETASTVRTILGQADALLGLSSEGKLTTWKILMTLLGGPEAGDDEVEVLCRQLQAFRIEREKGVAEEIREAVLTVGAKLRQVAAAREEVQGWERRLDELKAKAEQGMSTFPERTTTELRRIEAEGSLLEQVVAWNIARVKLAQAQGLLADRCGVVDSHGSCANVAIPNSRFKIPDSR
jgi:hypothetical protein